MHPGWLRRLTLGFLLCLSIDFANPLLPGSQRFDAAESIDAVRAARPRGTEAAAPAPPLETGGEPAPGPDPGLRAGGQTGRRAATVLAAMMVARRILPGAERPAPADDH